MQSHILKPGQIIKGIISGFLLWVFALGITPKQVLHDVLTRHQHIQQNEKEGAWVSKDRYNCNDENLVAESPFVEQDSSIKLNVPGTFTNFSQLFFTSYYFVHKFFFELRGPPGLA